MITNVTNLNESGQGHQSSSEKTMSSREIAKMTFKDQKSVLRSIRTMEVAWEKVCGRKFALTQYETKLPTGGTRKDPEYLLSKTECLYIATKFNDEARARLILRWEELENQHIIIKEAA